MKNVFVTSKLTGISILLAFISFFPDILAQQDPVQEINLLIGTSTFEDEKYLGGTPAGGYYSYYGSVIPGSRTPDGLVFLSPISNFTGYAHSWGSGYRHSDSTIMGFVHLSSQWSRNANISFMPVTGDLITDPGSLGEPESGYRSKKDFDSEIAKPHYYSVRLVDYNIKVELTVTDNAGFHRYTFPGTDMSKILVDLSISQDDVMDAHVSVEDDRHVSGWQECENYTVYFSAEFNKPFSGYGTWQNGDVVPGNGEQTGDEIGVYLEYRTSDKEEVLGKVGISLHSIQDAKLKLNQEIPGWDFDEIAGGTAERWNKLLSRIKVEGGSENQRTLFYTSLCRCFYRRENPISGLIPIGLIQQLLRPEWLSGHLQGIDWNSSVEDFWGPGSASAVLGIYRRGLTNFDLEAAYDAYCNTDNWRIKREFNKWGYIPYPGYKTYRESFPTADVVNRTLGYAYADHCIAQIAMILGKDEDYQYFMKSSTNYLNLFDDHTGFFRPRDLDGEWVTGDDIDQFDPTKPYHHRFYREGNAWQWLWLVPHNVNDLVQLLGGKDQFISKLDDFFSMPYDPGKPPFTIEQVQKGGLGVVDVSGMIGQYCHGNETDRYVPYYYTFAGQPWKTQNMVREIIDKLYIAKPGGLCGMDDHGGLSSWYVYSSMGFYPVRPEILVYNIGSPVFEKVTIDVGNGSEFVINAKNVSARNKYIQSAVLNGEPLDRPWFEHTDIMNGGRLVLNMGPRPNKQWGSAPEAAPPSMSR